MAKQIRSTQDAAGGIFLVVVSGIALWGSSGLSAGSLNQIGPGMLPRAFAVLLGVIGVAQIVGALIKDGASMELWHCAAPAL